MDEIKIPLLNFSISDYKKGKKQSFLVGMDATSQCNYVSFMEDNIYKIHMSLCDNKHRTYYTMNLDESLILVSENIYMQIMFIIMYLN